MAEPAQAPAQYRILIIEDESSIADTLTYALETEHFQATWVETAHAGLGLLSQQTFDLLVLDVGLPDMSGFEVLKRIRVDSQLPVIMLTARSEEIDRVLGLEMGADDYVTKPFSPREVVARVKAVLKRLRLPASQSANADLPLQLDAQTRSVQFFGQPVSLTLAEFNLLEALMRQPGRVLSRGQLMQRIWSPNHPSDERAIDTYIKTLRAKLRAINADYDPIHTHRGVGYSLKVGS